MTNKRVTISVDAKIYEEYKKILRRKYLNNLNYLLKKKLKN